MSNKKMNYEKKQLEELMQEYLMQVALISPTQLPNALIEMMRLRLDYQLIESIVDNIEKLIDKFEKLSKPK